MNDFCDRLHQEMNRHNFNPKSLGQAVGTSRHQVYAWLDGKHEPKRKFLAKLLKVFPNTDVRWLITGEHQK